jgi:hypothetical protein
MPSQKDSEKLPLKRKVVTVWGLRNGSFNDIVENSPEKFCKARDMWLGGPPYSCLESLLDEMLFDSPKILTKFKITIEAVKDYEPA